MPKRVSVHTWSKLFLFSLLLALFTGSNALATTPSSGSISTSNTSLSFTGGPFAVSNPSSPLGNTPPICTDVTCGVFVLTVTIPASDPTPYKVNVSVGWTNSGTSTQGSAASDYDVFYYQPDVTGQKVGQATTGPAGNPEVGSFRVPAGTTQYTIYVVPYDVSPSVPFTASVQLANATPPPPTPIPNPQLPAGTPRIMNYTSPTGTADSYGEPSIGANWQSGNVMMFGGLSQYAARVSFDDSTSPARATWTKTTLFLNTLPRAVGGDPILVTDKDTGRTIVTQLQFGTTTATSEYTDNDGATYQSSTGAGVASGIDHETVGVGPFPPGISGIGYRNAVWYCAQDDVGANCALSLDGGRTYGAAVPIATVADCVGIHGHVKIGPDGTVYVPNRSCGSNNQGVIVSENGLTWSVRTVSSATPSPDSDPSVGIASDGTVYFGYEAQDGHARIAVSHDKGLTWVNDTDVGAQLGIQNSLYPAVVAGDGPRAAYAFFGTTTAGNYNDPDFNGEWYLILTTTFDGGQTWTTQNVTPNDPVQRGSICTLGINCSGNTRNLLDFFDATIDGQGRILIGYDDGCITSGCIAGDKNGDGIVDGNDNDFTAKAVIARQAGGKRMLAAYDPVEPTRPSAPLVTGTREKNGGTVHLSWMPPDNGGSPITAYQIYRRTSTTTSFKLLAKISDTHFDDSKVQSTTTYIYRVTAVNAIGEGPSAGDVVPVTISAPPSCISPGMLALDDVNADGTDNDSAPNIPADGRVNIRQLFVAEPYFAAGVNELVFTLQVSPSSNGSAPANSQWYIIWNRLNPDSDFDRWYVAMKTDGSGVTSFEYGKFGVPLDPTNPNPNANTPVKLGTADSGNYDVANGVITITLSTSKAENIKAGQSLTDLNARTFLNQPDTGQKGQRTASDITDNGGYTLIGNSSCNTNPPTAALSAKPTKGFAPLQVNFSGSKSFDSDGDSIVLYTFDFGDGSSKVSQSSPSATHTYSTPGNYFATLTVTDSSGVKSTNQPSVGIQVKTH